MELSIEQNKAMDEILFFTKEYVRIQLENDIRLSCLAKEKTSFCVFLKAMIESLNEMPPKMKEDFTLIACNVMSLMRKENK